MRALLLVCLMSISLYSQVPQSQHVWLITEENHSYESVIGNTSMPYYNSIAQTYGLASQYYSPMHNSLAALFWLVAGQTVTVDNNTMSCFDVDNVIRHVVAQGLTWRSYQVDLPYPGFLGLYNLKYMRRHNPVIDFTDACTPQQSLNSVPYTQLATDITNHTTPNYAYITPNVDEDAHDGTLAEADQWLQQELPAILALPEFQPGGDGLLFIVWDEGDLGTDGRCSPRLQSNCGGRVATLVVGPQVKPKFTSSVTYTHANLLRTVCDAMEFTSCPAEGSWAAPMSDFFNTVNVSTPIDNAQVASPVHIVATTTDSSPVSSVQIYVDDILQYKISGSTLDALLPMSTGNHHVVVQSWDTAGGIHKRGVDVNVAAQEVNVSSPAPNAVVASPVLVSGTAKGKNQVSTMQVYVDDVLKYQSNSNSVSEHLSMATGSHHVVVQAWDTGGGITKTGVYITVATTPSVSIASPLSGANTYSPVQVVAAALDPAGVTAVQVYVDNILQYEMTGTGIAAPVPMSVGPHYVVVKEWNKLGKAYVNSVNINVLPITVAITSPPANATVDSPVHIQASAPKDSTVFTMQVYVDNVLQYQVDGTAADVWLSMSAGQHYIVGQAWDTGGLTWKTGEYITVR
jgi:phosphatidylinositol-3-phosphatase